MLSWNQEVLTVTQQDTLIWGPIAPVNKLTKCRKATNVKGLKMKIVASQTQIAVKQEQPYGIGLSMKCVASQTQLVHRTQILPSYVQGSHRRPNFQEWKSQ